MSELLDFALIRRLREVRERTTPATESELRVLTEQAEAWARTVDAQIHSSEHRIASLNSNPTSSLAQIAAELRRVETLRPQLREVQSLLSDLESRARELRTQWLLTQATSAGAKTRPRSGRRS
jgi:chromosome segregation ATPase